MNYKSDASKAHDREGIVMPRYLQGNFLQDYHNGILNNSYHSFISLIDKTDAAFPIQMEKFWMLLPKKMKFKKPSRPIFGSTNLPLKHSFCIRQCFLSINWQFVIKCCKLKAV